MSKLRDLYDEELTAQIASYATRSIGVLGLASVRRGERVLYPTTVYQMEGDETSGVAGMLMPDGEFIEAPKPRTTARYWEHEETLRYVQVEGELNESGTGPRVVGDSWTSGEVVWNGSVAGAINPSAKDGDETDAIRLVVNRRERESSLCGEWATNGELWRAMGRGTSMYQGRVPGKVHITFGEDDGGFAGGVASNRAA